MRSSPRLVARTGIAREVTVRPDGVRGNSSGGRHDDTQGFLSKVFGWMFLGLLITGLVAAAIGSNEALLTDISESPWLMIGLVVLQIGLVITIAAAINRLSPAAALGAVLPLRGDDRRPLRVHLRALHDAVDLHHVPGHVGDVRRGRLFGWVTKRDLSTMGTVLLMALIGLILATIVNVFLANETLYWITTYAGVAIFAGLTAYDMQKIKGYAHAGLRGRGRAARVDPGRAGPLPRLHQPLPVSAADLRPAR